MDSLVNKYQDTPQVQVMDNKGRFVRAVQYNREQAKDPVNSVVIQHRYNTLGQLVQSSDPRCVEEKTTPTLQQVTTLSGQVLRQAHVDTGIQRQLGDIVSASHWFCDAKAQQREWEYDDACRLTAVFEQDPQGKRRCSERVVYGDQIKTLSSETISYANLRGQVYQYDNTAGRREISAYTLQGQARSETLQFLTDHSQLVDWPEAERETLLESTDYTTVWKYSALGEVIQQTDAQDNVQGFRYDVMGQTKQTTFTLNQKTEQTLLQACDYNAQGQLVKATLDNGVTITRCYEPQTLRLVTIKATRKQSPQRLQDLHYHYDPVGNITRIEDKAQAINYHANQAMKPENNYEYDALYQLIHATGREQQSLTRQNKALPNIGILGNADDSQLVNYQRHYTYDTAGNLLKIQHQGQQPYSLDMHVDKHSHKAVYQEQDVNPLSLEPLQTSFDANGNPLYLNPGKQALHWDIRNQLQQFTVITRQDQAKDAEYYTYDGSGQRCQKISVHYAKNQQHTQRVRYLTGLELRERWQQTLHQDETRICKEALHVLTLNAGPVSVRLFHWEQGKPEKIDADDRHYALENHLGCNTLQVNQDADIVSYEEYYPYGGTAMSFCKNQVEADYQVIRYAGRERDATGLYYYGARYYTPWMGRWLNPDPAGTIDGLNLFKMLRNNPIAFYDTDGLWAKSFNLISIPSKMSLNEPIYTKMKQAYITTSTENLNLLGKEKPPKRTLPKDSLPNYKQAGPLGILKKFYYTGNARFIDKEGFINKNNNKNETIFIHGTFAAPAAEIGWTNPNNLSSTIKENFPGKINAFQWSGENNANARRVAGQILAKKIIQNTKQGLPTTVIAHSHGGNVAFEAIKAMQQEGGKIEQLITLGTPIIKEHMPTKKQMRLVDSYKHVVGSEDYVAGMAAAFNFERYGISMQRVSKYTDAADMQLLIKGAGHSDVHRPEVLRLFYNMREVTKL